MPKTVTRTPIGHAYGAVTGRNGNGLFLYLVLDKGRSNLAMARHQLRRVEEQLEI